MKRLLIKIDSPFLFRLLMYVFLPVAIAVALVIFFLEKSLPVVQGGITSTSVVSVVEISRDTNGIPFISVKNDMDGYAALGFAHAQDRLWQMEMGRRQAAGELAEVIGEESLSSDIFMRTMGLKRNAEKIKNNLSVEDSKILAAYVSGVNEGIASYRVLPIEFILLGYKPKPWTDVDSLMWLQLITLQLASGLQQEMQRALLVQAFGYDRTRQLVGDFQFTPLSTVNLAANEILKSGSLYPQRYKVPLQFVGSNSWVVSGKLTASGKPILANDPHLVNSIPSIFYLASVHSPNLNISGATFPGLPFFVAGRNEYMAWGVTNMMADTQDIFLEKINPNDRFQYLHDGQYKDMETYSEQIKIKAQFLRPPHKPYVLNVRRTHHGPVLSDLDRNFNGHVYSLRWTGDDETGGTFSSFIKLNKARGASEFKAALVDYVAPIHAFTYADQEGNIGYIAPGKYPLRKNRTGELPSEGWDSVNEWTGWIPFEQVPELQNPESGIIVNANNNILPKNYPFYIGSDWYPPFRADRIMAQLTQQGPMNSSDMVKLQLDSAYPKYDLLKQAIDKLIISDQQSAILQHLQKWDGDMKASSIEPLIIQAWLDNFRRLLIEDDANVWDNTLEGERWLKELALQENLPFIHNVLSGDGGAWCDYISSAVIESCDALLEIAFEHAVNELSVKYGSDWKKWTWGDAHEAILPHFPFSHSKNSPYFPKVPDRIWANVFQRSFASGGSGYSVNNAPASQTVETRFQSFIGASYRQVIDLSEHHGYFSISTGQSGNVMSKHYADQIYKHRDGDFVSLSRAEKKYSLSVIPLGEDKRIK